jgi:hypothetical protein
MVCRSRRLPEVGHVSGAEPSCGLRDVSAFGKAMTRRALIPQQCRPYLRSSDSSTVRALLGLVSALIARTQRPV